MIQHLDGNCHVYLDNEANAAMAVKIVENAKTQRYGTCNTAESLLVARSRAADLLPAVAAMLLDNGVEIRGCAETRAIARFFPYNRKVLLLWRYPRLLDFQLNLHCTQHGLNFFR